MPFSIQRVPRGLGDLLSTFGGQTPASLNDQLISTLDLLQFYGQQQQQFPTAANAALAEGGDIILNVPANQWWLIFNAHFTVVKTATMTALRGEVRIGLGDPNFTGVVVADDGGPFGATETGDVRFCFVSPYPRLLQPRSQIIGRLAILGTDATANCAMSAHVGVFG